MRVAAAFLLFSVVVLAQDRPAFDVASVRAHSSGDGAFSFDIAESGRLTVRNMTVWNLIREAYGRRDSQIAGGPGWLKNEGFDIVAQPGKDAPVARGHELEMLQSLLEDRFRLRWHEETRESNGYALRVSPSGAKLLTAKDGAARMQRGNLSAPSMTFESLCQIFEFELGKPVVDQTGLPGAHDIELQWARENPVPGEEPDTSRPSLFTAVREQLGLRLDAAKVPVKIFVIDDAQRPSAN